MPEVEIIQEEETYRLITDGNGRYAVVEARAGHVYSLDPQHIHEAPDSPDGMLDVVSDRGWKSLYRATKIFNHMVREEKHLAETLW